MSETALYDASAYLDRSFEAKGVGGWRKLYLSFIEDLAPYSVIELGAGAPEFLSRIEAKRRVAVDIGRRYADAFAARRTQAVGIGAPHPPHEAEIDDRRPTTAKDVEPSARSIRIGAPLRRRLAELHLILNIFGMP